MDDLYLSLRVIHTVYDTIGSNDDFTNLVSIKFRDHAAHLRKVSQLLGVAN
jgi:hypothetical protein